MIGHDPADAHPTGTECAPIACPARRFAVTPIKG